jgi:hypothetical protein
MTTQIKGDQELKKNKPPNIYQSLFPNTQKIPCMSVCYNLLEFKKLFIELQVALL